ncbi:MAG: hypothetical protein PVH87_19915 [Desulfobacteraceae bacterium]|jgi:hypothetical protein
MMKADPAYRDNLRQMLIQQFMLHEIQHHSLMGGAPRSQAPLTPVAHRLMDIYKCLHQGEFGVGHTIDHPEGFKQRLYQETMGGAAEDHVGEPAVESVSADGKMLRIHLRPLKRLYGDDVAGAVDGLARVCIESAQVTRGSNTRFFETLELFRMLNQSGEIALAGRVFAFAPARVETFLLEVRELMRRIGQIPVFSHSESYRRLNRPSYRVVERSVLRRSPLAALLSAGK